MTSSGSANRGRAPSARARLLSNRTAFAAACPLPTERLAMHNGARRRERQGKLRALGATHGDGRDLADKVRVHAANPQGALQARLAAWIHTWQVHSLHLQGVGKRLHPASSYVTDTCGEVHAAHSVSVRMQRTDVLRARREGPECIIDSRRRRRAHSGIARTHGAARSVRAPASCVSSITADCWSSSMAGRLESALLIAVVRL